ncbi:MAG TPA: hypothetical protein VGK15_00830 [Candidatus Limnocylindria bacterium]|jgi:hypothetical protein
MSQSILDTYSVGMASVIWAITFIGLFVSLVDAVSDLRDWPTVSDQIGDWSLRNPWLARLLVTVLFVLLAHFVMNPLHPATCPCVP